ncbi:MAG: flagellar basal body P-ring formation protein FlgA [Agarilytica sp.]
MKLRSFLASILAISFSTSTLASGTQDIDLLQQHVLEHTAEHYQNLFGKEKFEQNVQINVGRIDSRLRLAKCDNNLALKIKETPHNTRNITVKASCMNERRWTVYVPVSIDVYSEVLISTRSLQRGDVLQASDLDYQRVNTSTVGRGHIEALDRAVGMEIKRPISAGDVVRLPYLTKPDIVRKGQTVVVSSKSRFLSVETSGVALVNGHMGERIKVKNERSNRVVDAEVTAPGKVTIATR